MIRFLIAELRVLKQYFYYVFGKASGKNSKRHSIKDEKPCVVKMGNYKLYGKCNNQMLYTVAHFNYNS